MWVRWLRAGRRTKRRSAGHANSTCSISCSLGLFHGSVPRNTYLARVLVRVGAIDLQPAFDTVGSGFGVRPFADPFGGRQPIEDLRGRLPHNLEQLERHFVRPVVVEPARELVLIVSMNGRPILRQQQAKTNG